MKFGEINQTINRKLIQTFKKTIEEIQWLLINCESLLPLMNSYAKIRKCESWCNRDVNALMLNQLIVTLTFEFWLKKQNVAKVDIREKVVFKLQMKYLIFYLFYSGLLWNISLNKFIRELILNLVVACFDL